MLGLVVITQYQVVLLQSNNICIQSFVDLEKNVCVVLLGVNHCKLSSTCDRLFKKNMRKHHM